jgi:hypothetical protein
MEGHSYAFLSTPHRSAAVKTKGKKCSNRVTCDPSEPEQTLRSIEWFVSFVTSKQDQNAMYTNWDAHMEILKCTCLKICRTAMVG